MTQERVRDWQQLHVRVPHETYKGIRVYAAEQMLTMNQAHLELILKGLRAVKESTENGVEDIIP